MEIAELGFRVDTTGISKANRELDKLGSTGNKVGKSSEKTGGLIGRSFRNSAGGIGAAAGGLGVLKGALAGLGIGNAIAVTRNFEASMNDVEEKLGGTSAEMGNLRAMALEMGATTAFSASAAADAMSSLAAKGLETSEIIGILPDVLDLAAAAQISLEGSAKLTTATMNQFNIGVEESARVVDLLAAVGDSSGATIQGLEASLKKAGPAANAYGESLESTAAVIAILADNSIEAEVAGTAIAGMFSKLMVATGDGADALAEIGLASQDFINIAANGNEEFVGYADAIDLLSKNGASATQVARIFGLEAGKNLVPLVAAGADAIREMERSFGDASSAGKQAETQMQGLPGAMKNVASAWESVNIALVGQDGANLIAAGLNLLAGAMRTLATDVIPLLQPLIVGLVEKFVQARQTFNEFRDDMRDSSAWPIQVLRDISVAFSRMGEFLAPLIPYLDDFGTAAVAIGGAAFGVSLIAGALAAVAAVVLSPVVLGVASIAAGAVLLREHWEPVSEWWAGVWGGIRTNADSFFTWWSNTTLEEKRVQIREGALEFVRQKYSAFIESWNETTLEDKLLSISTSALDFASDASREFSSWWNDSELRSMLPDVVTSKIDLAQIKIQGFFGWWDTQTLEEKTASVKAASIDFVRNQIANVLEFWNETTLSEKVAIISTKYIDIFMSVARGALEFWNQSKLKALLPDVITDRIDRAIEIIQSLHEWWTTTTLREKAADLTFETVTKAYALLQTLKGYWDNLIFSAKDLMFNIPSFEDVTSGAGGIFDKFVAFGSEIGAGIGDGIGKSVTHIAASRRINSEVEAQIAGLPENAEQVGRDVTNGLAVGMAGAANDANTEATGLASGVLGALKAAFRTRSPSKETEAIGAFVTQGLTAGMGIEADNLYSFTRQMSGEVLDQLGNMKDAANDKLAFLGDGLSAAVEVKFNIDDSQFDKVKSFLNQGGNSGRPTSQRGHDVENARNAADGQADKITDATDKAAALAQIEQAYQDQVSDIVRSGEGTRAQFREASFADQIAGTINKYSQEINIAGGLVDSLLGLETQKAEATAKASLTEAQTLAQAAADAQAIYESTGTEENRILAANAAEKSAIAEAAARRDFEKQKEAQIAQARVSQGLAIVNAYASGGNFLTGLALAATAAFVTERQIRGIKSQQFNGGASLTAAPSSAASGSTSASSGSTATGSSEAGQNIQIVNLNGVLARDTNEVIAENLKQLADDGYILDSSKNKLNTQNITTRSANAA